MSRFIPYGYQIQNGEYVVEEQTASVVRRIYDLYSNGLSYSGISECLNREGTNYTPEHPDWNKNLIKRILENQKYTGADPYPAIISEAEFQKVRDILAMRNANRTVKTPADDTKLWKYITCGACGGKLYRTGQRTKDGAMAMRCRQCNLTLNLPKEHLQQEVLRQYLNYTELPKEYVAQKKIRDKAREVSELVILGGSRAGMDISELQKQVSEITAEQERLLDLILEDMDDPELNGRMQSLTEQKTRLISDIERRREEMTRRETDLLRMKDIDEWIAEHPAGLREYDDAVTRRLIERVTVIDATSIRVKFKGDSVETTVRLPE